ncbi:MAG: TatD family hydrolase [Candidatus Bipolaricaulis sp.]|nr:TatD family hydrolase [Candidatus Bipolaricaulis sp.]MDD5646432.1 TatD family hydrolase [Candidatus Bipolaricaulis sp.]
MRLIDSHAHLDDDAFDKDRAALVAKLHAEEIGVVTVGADLASSREAVRLAARHRQVWAAVGVHPHDAKSVTPAVLRELEALAKEPKVVAIGEIGLDYYRDLSPRDVQRQVFAEQLALAKRLGLPVAIHNRESTDDLVRILRKAGASHRGVIHSFLGNFELAQTFLDLAFHLGVGGPLTYPANAALRDAIRHVPLDRILLETDCPYLTPVPHRGKRNEPAYVGLVAKAIADLRGAPPSAVAEVTTRNAIAVFGLAASSVET